MHKISHNLEVKILQHLKFIFPGQAPINVTLGSSSKVSGTENKITTPFLK